MAFLPGPTNFINDALYGNCQRPMYIYVLTAIPCFIDAVLMLRWFDFEDIVRARASTIAEGGGRKPKGPGHTRTKRVSPMKGTGDKRGYKMGLHHLLIITQPLEKIGFALLLYGVVNKFYFDWMMYLDDADACINPSFFGPFIRRVEDGHCFPSTSGNTLQLPTIVSNPANWSSNTGRVDVPIGRYRIVWAATVIGPNNGASYSLQIRVNRGLGILQRQSDPVYCAPDTETDIIVTADVICPLVTGGRIVWAIAGPAIPVGLQVKQADVYVQRMSSAFSD